MSEYEDTPYIELPRADGTFFQFFRRKDDPTRYKTMLEGVPFDWTNHLQSEMEAGKIKK